MSVTSTINGGEQGRSTTVPIVMIIHKGIGEQQIRGLEMYGDMSPVEDTLKEVAMKAAERH